MKLKGENKLGFVLNNTNGSVCGNESITTKCDARTLFQPEITHEIVVAAVAFLGVLIMVLSMLSLIKSGRTTNFFYWKTFERFTIYIMFSDILLCCEKIGFRIYKLLRNKETAALCAIHRFFLHDFILMQVLLNLWMAINVVVLVLRNRSLNLGKYDRRMLMTVIFTPVIILIPVLAIQLVHNGERCGFNDDQDLLYVHFVFFFAVGFVATVIIITLYMILFCHVYKATEENIATLDQSAVQPYRIAFKLSLYVGVFLIKFGGTNIEGVWRFFEPLPRALKDATTIMSAAGGIMYGMVYFGTKRKDS